MQLYFGSAERASIVKSYLFSGQRHLCMSFQSVGKSEETFLSILDLIEGKSCDLMLEPGTHAWRRKKDNRPSPEEVEAYFERYAEFIRTHHSAFSVIMELDVQDILSPEATYEYRDRLIDLWSEEDIDADLLPVMRLDPSDEDLDQYELFDYIAVPTRDRASEYWKVINLPGFKDRRVKIHAIGPKKGHMREVPFFSAHIFDPMYGGTYKRVFSYKGSLRMAKLVDSNDSEAKTKRAKMSIKGKVVKAEVDWDDFLSSDYRALNDWNAIQWYKYATDLGKKSGSAYWNPDKKASKQDSTTRAELVAPSKQTKEIDVRRDLKLQIKRACNTCALADLGCPAFKRDSECSLESDRPINNQTDMLQAYSTMLEMQMERMMFAMMEEKLSGRPPSPETNEMFESTTRMLKDFNHAASKGGSFSINASGEQAMGIVGMLLSGAVPGQRSPGHGTLDPVALAANKVAEKEAREASRQRTEDLQQDILDAEFEETTDHEKVSIDSSPEDT